MARSKDYWCWVEAAVNIIGGKWKLLIVITLRDGKLRYSEILHKIPEISDKMLVKQLRELEQDGIVERKVYAVVPPKVEYSLTLAGEKLVLVMKVLGFWGFRYLDDDVVGERLSREKCRDLRCRDPERIRILLKDIEDIQKDIEEQLKELGDVS
ncbi:DNA-binding HxlR family transcriptional regulator [Methanomicrobium sp. W14]|uniref:winged helix-turn-helix transcriptional regulator n=1 Tax=Methanomicrobium sp. W14 TaxID=2817839 RepID=UPI001AE86806|nr:winged helix-turn-helix transcriptional regulator [Methanomicrobium sp. W14]MBP2133266.1 DNA-binding HxlR family transcriptional regulator [Methanomicrobium sp. W14]